MLCLCFWRIGCVHHGVSEDIVFVVIEFYALVWFYIVMVELCFRRCPTW